MTYRLIILFFVIIGCNSQANKKDIKNSNILLNKSSDHIKQGDFYEAVKSAKEAIKYSSDNYVAYNNLAVAYEKMDCTFVLTESMILKSYSLNNEYRQTLLNLITIYFDHKNYKNVVRYGDEYLDLYEGNSYVFNMIGESYRVLDKYDDANEYLIKAINSDTTNGITYMNMAELQMNLSKYQSAISYLYKARLYYNNTGNIYLYSRNGAVKKYTSGILNELGVCHYQLKAYDSALYYVNQALSLDSQSVYIVNKGLYLMKSDFINEGCELFNIVENRGRSIKNNYSDGEPYKLQLEYCIKKGD